MFVPPFTGSDRQVITSTSLLGGMLMVATVRMCMYRVSSAVKGSCHVRTNIYYVKCAETLLVPMVLVSKLLLLLWFSAFCRDND